MSYDSKLKNKETDDLFHAILLLQNEEECYRFFEDLCTIKELQAISQRFQVATLLDQKKTYTEIEEITGASTATISRVNRCLMYGAEGYRTQIERIKQESAKEL